MPIEIVPRVPEEPRAPVPETLTRRSFLRRVAATAACMPLGIGHGRAQNLRPAEAPGDLVFALISDTHVASLDETLVRGFSMAANLESAAAQVIAAAPKQIIHCGDLAHIEGLTSEYERFLAHAAPLFSGPAPVHFVLGNHDHRDRCLAAAKRIPDREVVAAKHVADVRAHGLRWLFLDSLDVVNKTPGSLGADQLRWLDASLGADSETPALLIVHHNPEESAAGLKDHVELTAIVERRHQVQAVFFGHTHAWRRWERGGAHFVNLPAVAYNFTPSEPVAWVLARSGSAGIDLELHCLDTKDSRHLTRQLLPWRQAPRRLRV